MRDARAQVTRALDAARCQIHALSETIAEQGDLITRQRSAIAALQRRAPGPLPPEPASEAAHPSTGPEGTRLAPLPEDAAVAAASGPGARGRHGAPGRSPALVGASRSRSHDGKAPNWGPKTALPDKPRGPTMPLSPIVPRPEVAVSVEAFHPWRPASSGGGGGTREGGGAVGPSSRDELKPHAHTLGFEEPPRPRSRPSASPADNEAPAEWSPWRADVAKSRVNLRQRGGTGRESPPPPAAE